jgi:uncharacterized protein (TIGR00369 family)
VGLASPAHPHQGFTEAAADLWEVLPFIDQRDARLAGLTEGWQDDQGNGSEETHMATILEGAQKVLHGESPPPPIGRLLGLVLKAIEPGRALFVMEADERHHNPMGTLHGGIYCDLADAAMGYAYAATLGEGETFTTIELKINFLRPVRKATLTTEARVVKAGSNLGYVECDVKDGDGRLVARAASTCMKLREARPTT